MEVRGGAMVVAYIVEEELQKVVEEKKDMSGIPDGKWW